MPSESAKKAARAWLEDETFHEAGWEALDAASQDAAAERLAERLESYARDWARELGLAWDRRGEEDGAPAVPVLQPRYDALLARLGRAEKLLAHALEIVTTADEERQSEILRRWGLRLGASTPRGALGRLLAERRQPDGAAVEIADCGVCAGQGNFPELGHGFGLTIDCSACDGTGRVPARRES